MNETTIHCYLQSKTSKGGKAYCVMILTDDRGNRAECSIAVEGGKYIDGLIGLLHGWILSEEEKLRTMVVKMVIHVHHRNTNLTTMLRKSIKTAGMAGNFGEQARDMIIKQSLTRKNRTKPQCYDVVSSFIKTLTTHYRLQCECINDSSSQEMQGSYLWACALEGEDNGVASAPA